MNLYDIILEKSKPKSKNLSKFVLDLYPIYNDIKLTIENELTIKQTKKLFKELKNKNFTFEKFILNEI